MVKIVIVIILLVGIFVWRWWCIVANTPVLQGGENIKLHSEADVISESNYGRRWVNINTGKQVIQVVLAPDTKINWGDNFEVSGRVDRKVIDDGQVIYTLNPARFVITGSGWPVKYSLARVREKLIIMVESWIPGNEGALASGILLGGSSGMASTAREDFRKVGLLHIVAASGYNVGVVAGWLAILGVWLVGRRWSILFVILGIILYMYLAGLSAAVVRAGIMAIITLVGLLFGRRTDASWMLLATVMVMIIRQPLIIYDIGFQLSVAAMAGLIWVDPVLKNGVVINDLRTTLAAQVLTTPLIMHHFGNLSLVSPIVNALLLWTVPVVMQITALAVGVGLFWAPAGRRIALTCWPLLKILTEGVRLSANIPGSNWTTGNLSWGWVAGYYGAVGAGIFFWKKVRHA